jgi:circadian clock protein KaiB
MAEKYLLKLYVMGETEVSKQTIINLKAICKEHIGGYDLEVIDLKKNIALAEEAKIFATPTIERKLPLPIRRIVGDLSDKAKVLIGLDLITQGAFAKVADRQATRDAQGG